MPKTSIGRDFSPIHFDRFLEKTIPVFQHPFFKGFCNSQVILPKLHNFADHFAKSLKSSKIGW
jgi:hypothetical protein